MDRLRFITVTFSPSTNGYYPQFGFSAAQAQALACPFGDGGEACMALGLTPGALRGVRGRVVYPPAINDVRGCVQDCVEDWLEGYPSNLSAGCRKA